VLADGRLVKASAQDNPDLYWAIRGGGGNFGIVTAFEVALHPVSKVFAGNITLESPDPREFLRAFREFISTAPTELTLIALMSAEPSRKPRITIQACYAGDPTEGEKVMAPLRHHPALVDDTVRLRPYLELEQMVPADIPPSYEEHCGGFFSEFDDRKIEFLANALSSAPFPVDCFLVHLHGAVTRVPVTATPFPLRVDGIAWDVAAYWKHPGGQRVARNWIDALSVQLPIGELGAYVNVMDREGESAVRRAYATNYARLQQLKTRYDPRNLFSLNQNIRPA
jgi:FAD/FMN-containing dehydrogenase